MFNRDWISNKYIQNILSSLVSIGNRITALESTAEGTYAEIYVNGNSTAQSIPTGSSFTKITPFTTNGVYNNCTTDAENNKISITESGHYKIEATFSSKLGTTDVLWDTSIFIGGVEAENIHMRRKFSTSGYTFTVCLSGIVNIAEACDIDVRSKHDNVSSVDITIEYANLNVIRLGD